MASGVFMDKQQIVPIFSGGGTRLPCYLGILQAIEELNLEFQHLVGVSGGSIVAAMVATGKSLEQMRQVTNETNFRQFKRGSLLNLLRTGGLSSGDVFEQWLDHQLEGKTFSELELDLHVLATDINGGGPVVFNRKLTPTIKVSKAVRFSMSIPLLFSFKTFDNHVMADGVILAEDALHRDWSGRSLPVICFRLKSESEDKPVPKRRWLPLISYVSMLIQTFMNAMSREYVHAQYWHNTVVINTGNISAVDFDIDVTKKEFLREIGYRTAKEIIPIKLKNVLATLRAAEIPMSSIKNLR